MPQSRPLTVRAALADLDAAGYVIAVELASTPDLVRGYEDVKLAGVQRFRAAVADASKGIAGSKTHPPR
jgi:indolepyruvate ferredoxin oxidoreductase